MSDFVLIVKAFAPELKTIPSNTVKAESEISVRSDTSNVALFDSPSGTVSGVQFAAVFQSLLLGLSFQVALPASLGLVLNSNSKAGPDAAVKAG